MDKQLMELEIRIAHQEKAIQELSDTIYEQHRKIEQLDILCRHLSDKLRNLSDQAAAEPADEAPPHY